jgi:magnesium chelatase subunit D
MAMTIDLRDESLFADVLAALEHVMPMAAEAEREVSQPRLSDEQEETLTGAAVMLDVASSRPLTHAAAVARACAVQRADPVVGADDIALAIRLALVPHARRLPQFNQSADDAPAPDEALSPDTASDPANEAPSPAPEHGPEDDPSQDSPESALPDGAAERLVEAALATLPPEVLADLAGRAGRRTGSSSAAGAGQLSSKGRGRGRSIGARRGLPQGGARVHLFATLRAAMPWQRWRERVARMRSEPLSSASGPRLRLSKDDLHIHREVHRRGTTTLFVVDASGSTALQRLNEAKGAVELLLADCYVRRDRVALICFRGRGAEMLLAPTRSLVAARRALSALPGGGGSPVAAGLELALRVASGVGRAGDDTQLVVLTDGRANLTRDGRPGREEAARDAQAMARELSRVATHRVLIDTSLRPEPAAQRLAEALSARYCPMPFARAQAIRSAIG